MEPKKNKKQRQNGNRKISNWNWINIISFFVVQPSPTSYDKMPCSQHRRMHACTYTVYIYMYVIKFSVLGRTASLVQFHSV